MGENDHTVKVFHIINGFGPGGAERSLVELLPMYRHAGIDSAVVHLKDRNVGYTEEAKRLGLPLFRLPGQTVPGWVRALRRRIKEERPDVIHTSLFESDIVGRFAAAGTGIPVLSSLVSLSYDAVRKSDTRLNQKAFRFVKMVDGFTARNLTTHFHALTETVKSAYVDALGLRPDRITVVPRGRSRLRLGERSAERRMGVRQRLGIDPDRPLLLNVGRQEYAKGQVHLLDAMPRVLQHEPRAFLLVAGRAGIQTPLLQARMREHGLEKCVQFLGHREDVTDLMAAADVFLFPSLFEGLGGSAIEAMGLGLPVVASDIPVLREVVGDEAGLFARLGDPESLADATLRILSMNGKAERLGQAGMERFRSHYDLQTTAAAMIELYRRVSNEA